MEEVDKVKDGVLKREGREGGCGREGGRGAECPKTTRERERERIARRAEIRAHRPYGPEKLWKQTSVSVQNKYISARILTFSRKLNIPHKPNANLQHFWSFLWCFFHGKNPALNPE